MAKVDLLPYNIQNFWYLLPATVRNILGGDIVDFGHKWVSFNVQDVKDITLPVESVDVVLTYHTEYIKYHDLKTFFEKNKNIRFLLLTDWTTKYETVWGENVTALPWITWHHQLQNIMCKYEINKHVQKPSRKISILSYRHEFHKAAVTAYAQRHFSEQDILWSWWNVREPNGMYYLAQEYFLPEKISQYVLDENFQKTTRCLDHFVNSPMSNSDWRHPAYTDCLFNCTNESVFNDVAELDGQIYSLLAPYLTEKTWKPLLAGRPFIPVSQSGSLSALIDLGLRFVPEVLTIDQTESEFSRILAIWEKLDWIIQTNLDELYDYTLDSVQHNLHWIADGNFFQCCKSQNEQSASHILDWLKS